MISMITVGLTHALCVAALALFDVFIWTHNLLLVFRGYA